MSLEELIAIDTQNPGADYAAMTRHLRDELEARGAKVSRVAGNVLAAWGTPRLLFNAHMDTVRADGWRRDPLRAWTRTGKVYGLGACDTKGNIQAILDATAGGAQNLAVLFSTDEECGPKTGTARFFQTAVGKKLARTVKGAVVMEPTENQVVTRHPGYVQVELAFLGSGGHSSSKKGSAAGLAVMALHRMQKQGGWNVNVGTIRAESTGANVRAPRCTAVVSVRSYQPARKVLGTIKSMLPPNAAMKAVQAEGPLDNRHPFIGPRREVPYWTDAAVMQAAGINTVVYGAGSIHQAHRPDEFVTRASLGKAVAFLKRAMEAHAP